MTARVGDANQVRAIRRRGKEKAGIGAELTLTIIVISIIERESGQAVGDEFGSWRMGLDDVSRFIKGVGGGAGIEIIAAFVLKIVKLETGIGSLRHAEDLA